MALAIKISELVDKLRDLADNVKADDVESRFKSAKDQAIRTLRDKSEIFESGGNVIKLGPKHKFSVNSQELDLTIVPKDDQLCLQLTGTDYQEVINHSKLQSYKAFWPISLESESPTVYRAEYLAYSLILSVLNNENGLTYADLVAQLTQPDILTKTVRDFAALRYREGYEKGIHDHDAIKIITKLIPLGESAGLLRYSPFARSLAMLYWQYNKTSPIAALWPERAKTCMDIYTLFGHDEGLQNLRTEMATAITQFLQTQPISHEEYHIKQATEYLSYTLAKTPEQFILSKYGKRLFDGLKSYLDQTHMWGDFNQSQLNLKARLAACAVRQK